MGTNLRGDVLRAANHAGAIGDRDASSGWRTRRLGVATREFAALKRWALGASDAVVGRADESRGASGHARAGGAERSWRDLRGGRR
jgi:hypothetical protein